MKLEVEVKVSSRRGERLLSTHITAGHRVVYVDAHTYRCETCSHTLLVEQGRSRHEDSTPTTTTRETEGQARARVLRERRAQLVAQAASPESQAVWLARIRADLAARKGTR